MASKQQLSHFGQTPLQHRKIDSFGQILNIEAISLVTRVKGFHIKSEKIKSEKIKSENIKSEKIEREKIKRF